MCNFSYSRLYTFCIANALNLEGHCTIFSGLFESRFGKGSLDGEFVISIRLDPFENNTRFMTTYKPISRVVSLVARTIAVRTTAGSRVRRNDDTHLITATYLWIISRCAAARLSLRSARH